MVARAVIPFFLSLFCKYNKTTLNQMNYLKEDFQEFTNALRTLKFWYMLLTLTLGCFIFSFVVNGILLPHNFFAGGLTGLALLFYDSIKEYISFSLTLCSSQYTNIYNWLSRIFSEIHHHFTDWYGDFFFESSINTWS